MSTPESSEVTAPTVDQLARACAFLSHLGYGSRPVEPLFSTDGTLHAVAATDNDGTGDHRAMMCLSTELHTDSQKGKA